MVRLVAFLASVLVNLACAQLAAMPRLRGLRMTEPSLVDRSADLAGFGIVADFAEGPAIRLFDVLDDPCLWDRARERKREVLMIAARAEACFPVEADPPASVWQTD